MTISSPLFSESAEIEHDSPFYLQNNKLLKVELLHGPVRALTGSMIAYQGDVKFARKGSGGLGKFLMKNITGQGDNLMSIEGRGELFLGHGNAEVQILYLDNDSVIINSENILAFSDTLEENIERVKTPGSYMAGSLFNLRLSGTGYIAILTAGYPFSLKVSPKEDTIFADPQAVVLWTPNVHTSIKVDAGGLGTILRGGTGESVQMMFSGEGIVVCQSSELLTNNQSNNNSNTNGPKISF